MMYDRCSARLKLLVKPSRKCNGCAFVSASNLVLLGHSCAPEIQTSQYMQCDQCDRILLGALGLQRHKKHLHEAREQGKWFMCEFCDYKAIRKASVQKHILRLHLTKEEKEKKWFKCDYCDFRSALKSDMKTHNRKHTTVEDKILFRCSFCSLTTNNERSLKQHIKRKHREGGELWHECDSCPFKTLYAFYLRSHKKQKHGNEVERQQLECEFCTYKTLDKYSLKRHTQIQHTTGEGLWFKCTICDYKALTKKRLNEHVERQACAAVETVSWLRCQKCDAKFKRKPSLLLHTRRKHGSDQGESMFQCYSCDFKHIYEHAVNYHMAYNHTEEPAKCVSCGKIYKNQMVLKQHVRSSIFCKRNDNVQY